METAPAQWLAPARPDEVGRLRRAATAAAADRGLSGPSLDHLRLAVSEALTNAVLHAYPEDREPGPMSLEVKRENRALRVIVRDEGQGMGVRPDTHGLGLGLGILASIADFCEIRTARGAGMRVTIGFEL